MKKTEDRPAPPPANSAAKKEERLSRAQVATQCGVSEKTVDHWIRDGIRTPGGRVRLASRRVGGRRFTTPEALAAFDKALNPVEEAAGEHIETAAESRRREQEVDDELKSFGINLNEPPKRRKTSKAKA
ncbi:hypothetical protein [Zavarzinella formosa]|uniref:hypothetical protein n=1 Tax=Zavarzinella formosa TaxID=360055 RepID=UPI0002E6BB07|nr:hypothetical protein [Zavarzinella formosa]